MSDVAAQNANRLICLLDHDLKCAASSQGAHSWTIAQAFLESRKLVEVWAHTSCNLSDPRVAKTFRKSVGWVTGMMRAKTRLGFRLRYVAAFAYSNASYLTALFRKRVSPGTVLFAINASQFMVPALQLYAAVHRRVQVVVYFQQSCSRSNAIAGLAHRLLRLRKSHYGTETKEMAVTYNQVLRLPCHHIYVPLPKRSPEETPSSNHPPFRVLVPGQPRREKGFDIVVSILRLMREEFVSGRLEVTLQANGGAPCEAALREDLEDLRRLAGKLPNIQLLPVNVSEECYARLIRAADMLWLPYRRSAYSQRSSGIAVEALIAGKPVVVTDGLTFSSTLDREGVAVLAGDEDPVNFAQCVRRLMASFEQYHAKAREAASRYRLKHSIDLTRDALFGIAGAQ